MRIIAGAVVAAVVAGAVVANASPLSSPPQGPPPLDDARLAISTLIREDFFAGFIDKDMARLDRGMASVETLLKTRPEKDRAGLLSWKGGGQMYKAVLAYEAGKKAEYKKLFAESQATLAEARRVQAPQDVTVYALVGGTAVLWGDRLPKEDRKAVWEAGYQAYQGMCAVQCGFADKLPSHIKGELMAGLVQTAQRTGRTEEANQQLDKMLVLVKDTPYEAQAKVWKDNPKAADSSILGCKNCNDAGRLAPTLATLNAKPPVMPASTPAQAAPGR